MGSNPGFCNLASNCMQQAQLCMLPTVSCTISGHQNRSLIRLRVWSRPWCPVCLWQLSIAARLLWVGTMKAKMSLLLQLGVVLRYSRPLLRVKSFCRAAYWHWIWSGTCPQRNSARVLWSSFGCFSHCVVSWITSSLCWAITQWLSARFRKAMGLSSSIYACMMISCSCRVCSCISLGLSVSALGTIGSLACLSNSRTESVSNSSLSPTWLSASATLLSTTQRYSMVKLNPARDATQWYPTASRLGVDIM